MSSGTSGVPTLWPRGYQQEAEAAFIHEFLFTDLYEADKYKTLIVICFPMGVYVSGVATAIPTVAAAFKHAKVSVVTAGNNKDSALLFLQHFSSEYEQIVLVGHPFFIKDVIETGVEEKMRWTRMRVRTMFCSEGFSEAWRAYVASLLHTEATTSILSTYGSSEFLLTGFENPSTIGVRIAAEKDTVLRERLFGGSVIPSLFQFNPLSRFIESVGGDLVVTAAAGIPLVRYNQHDMGMVLPFAHIHDVLKNNHQLRTAWQWPFVTLFGRSDRTLVLYAANIYPEHIQLALSTAQYVQVFTGKFFMEKKELPRMEQKMVIHIELRPGVKAPKGFEMHVRDHLVRELTRINIEYRDASAMLGGEKMVPIILLHQHGDPSYFKPGLKPRFMAPR
jgi:phenylacetate-CoA ligase